MGIQMAPGAGVNLPDRNPGGSDPHRVIVSLLVTLDYGKPESFAADHAGYAPG